ncbi:lasso RiPP family leader peptide-containing protein [Spirosoma koreense]
MNNDSPKKAPMPVRKAYRSPKLVSLGSVRQLTLKIGSVSDGMGLHV